MKKQSTTTQNQPTTSYDAVSDAVVAMHQYAKPRGFCIKWMRNNLRQGLSAVNATGHATPSLANFLSVDEFQSATISDAGKLNWQIVIKTTSGGSLELTVVDYPVGGLFVEDDGLESTVDDDELLGYYASDTKDFGEGLREAITETGMDDAFDLDAWTVYLRHRNMLITVEDGDGGYYYIPKNGYHKQIKDMLVECAAVSGC